MRSGVDPLEWIDFQHKCSKQQKEPDDASWQRNVEKVLYPFSDQIKSGDGEKLKNDVNDFQRERHLPVSYEMKAKLFP